MPGTTDKVHLLKAEANQYCGTSETWTDTDWGSYTYKTGTDEWGNDVYKYTKDLSKMYDRLSKGYLCTSSSDKTWIKVGNCADGYYSDWIVSFLPANSTILPTYYSRRVIAEDLGTAEATDFDYNDVVFDVVQDETNTTVTLRAAGGTLPLYLVVFKEDAEIADNYSFNPDDSKIAWVREVHDWFGVATTTMVNTNNGTVSANPQSYTFADRLLYAGDVRIFVYKEGYYEICAYEGKPAQKLAVGTDYQWLDERVSIINQSYYGSFLEYVHNQTIFGENSYKLWYTSDPYAEINKTYDEEHQGTIGL